MPETNRSDALRAAKETLISEGLLRAPEPSGVPDLIERSWRRSLASGVTPHVLTDRDVTSVDTGSLLYRGALPVMEQLASDLADMEVAALICDATGRIIYRTVHSARQQARLDAFGASPGFDFSEATVGTNGLGTVIEERRGLVISDVEHFNDALERETCAGAPIIDPRTRRVAGSLSLTAPVRSASPIMTTLTVGTARQIEQRMGELVSNRRRTLLEAFESAAGTASGPIAVLSADTVLADPDGLAYLNPSDHARIWDALMQHPGEWPARITVSLGGGRPVDLDVRALPGPADHPAFEIAFVSRDRRATVQAAPSAVRLHPIASVDREIRDAARSTGVLTLRGPASVGKHRSATRVLRGNRRVLTRTAAEIENSGWGELAAALETGAGVVLRRVEELTVDGAASLRRTAEAVRDDSRVRLVLCLNPALASSYVAEVAAGLGASVDLPSLAAARDSIPDVVRSVAPGAVVSAPAMRALMRWDWPGNVGELERVLNEAVRRTGGAIIAEADLPRALRDNAAGADLGGLARSEREAIIDALRAAGGNRSAAAQALGIGRTTLYRKLRALKIDA